MGHSRHFDGLAMTFAVGTRVTSRPPLIEPDVPD